MARILISLVGGRPLPNLLVALHLQPDHLAFIVSNDSVGPGRDYEKTMLALPRTLQVEEKIVDPYKLQESVLACHAIIDQHLGDEIIIHATLGPKTMAFGAYDAAKELKAKGIKIDVCYLARESLVWAFKDTIEPVTIGLAQYFTSYGWNVRWKTAVHNEKFQRLVILLVDNVVVAQRLLTILRDHDRGKDKRTLHCKRQLAADEYSLLQEIAQLQIISNIQQNAQGVSWTLNSQEDADDLLTGNWLEYYLYQIAAHLTNAEQPPSFFECGWGVEDTMGRGEIDFAGIFGGQLLIASCKTETGIKRTWFEELHSKADQLGKGMCSSLLVTSVARSTRTERDLQQYAKWAHERQIVLLMAEDLPNLAAILRKTILADENAEPTAIPCYPRI